MVIYCFECLKITGRGKSRTLKKSRNHRPTNIKDQTRQAKVLHEKKTVGKQLNEKTNQELTGQQIY